MALVVNGWTLLYHPAFGDRFAALRDEVCWLKRSLSPDEFRAHPVVKLAASVRHLVLEVVPPDPDAAEFRLSADLAQFRRAKGLGRPPRYRLFWAFSTRAQAIIFLSLNDEATLRKRGARSDPYDVFRGVVRRGEIGEDFEAKLRVWEERRG